MREPVLHMKTRYAVISGKKPNNSEILVFGCCAFLYTKKKQRGTRLANHSVRQLFTGKHDGQFQIYLPKEGLLVEARHAIFDETFSSLEQVIEDDKKKHKVIHR